MEQPLVGQLITFEHGEFHVHSEDAVTPDSRPLMAHPARTEPATDAPTQPAQVVRERQFLTFSETIWLEPRVSMMMPGGSRGRSGRDLVAEPLHLGYGMISSARPPLACSWLAEKVVVPRWVTVTP